MYGFSCNHNKCDHRKDDPPFEREFRPRRRFRREEFEFFPERERNEFFRDRNRDEFFHDRDRDEFFRDRDRF